MANIPWFAGFHASQVVQEFFHQQYFDRGDIFFVIVNNLKENRAPKRSTKMKKRDAYINMLIENQKKVQKKNCLENLVLWGNSGCF